jgi:hypothetical protein
VLDPDTLTTVVQRLAEHDASHPAARAIVAASMVRAGDEQGARASLAAMLARAIVKSYVPASTDTRGLTGHARLVAFLAELLADTRLVDEEALVLGLAHGALVSDPALAARWVMLRSPRAEGMMGRIARGLTLTATTDRGARPPACALEAAWADRTIDVGELCRLARVVKPRRHVEAHLRGRADGSRAIAVDFDPDPSLRPPAEMSRVIEALDPRVRVSPRALLVFLAATPKALAIGGRDMRGWAEGADASQLHRVLRAARGAAEGDARVAKLDVHADEAGMAAALLARSARGSEVVALMDRGLRLRDGLFFAATIEALAALGRPDDVRVLVDALASRRRNDPAALSAWLVVGEIDRPRTTSVLAGALDAPCAATAAGPLQSVYEALMLIERRRPGTLERLRASTRTGQAAVVNALARAYPGLVGH